MNNDNRYIPIEKSIKESFKEIKLIRDNKLPKETWDGFYKAAKSE